MRPVAAVIAFVFLALAGCASQPASAASQRSPMSASGAAAFGGTDLAYIEVSIAMNEQVAPMIGLVPGRTDNQKMQAFATLIGSANQALLSQFRALHDQAGLSPVNPHEGMPMPGMVLPVQVKHAGELTGQAFDDYVHARLQGYFEQLRLLARSEIKSGSHPETRRIADQSEQDATQALLQLASI